MEMGAPILLSIVWHIQFRVVLEKEGPGPGLEGGKWCAEGTKFKEALILRVIKVLTLHLQDPETKCLLKCCALAASFLESCKNRACSYTILEMSDSLNFVL